MPKVYCFGIPSKVREDILERRRSGESLDELSEEYQFLTKQELNDIIEQIDQVDD